MSAKPTRSSIASALSGIMGKDVRQPQTPSAPPPTTVIPPSRRGKKQLLTHHDPAAVMQLKQLSVDTGYTQQKLVAEALNLLFVKYGKPPIA